MWNNLLARGIRRSLRYVSIIFTFCLVPIVILRSTYLPRRVYKTLTIPRYTNSPSLSLKPIPPPSEYPDNLLFFNLNSSYQHYDWPPQHSRCGTLPFNGHLFIECAPCPIPILLGRHLHLRVSNPTTPLHPHSTQLIHYLSAPALLQLLLRALRRQPATTKVSTTPSNATTLRTTSRNSPP